MKVVNQDHEAIGHPGVLGGFTPSSSTSAEPGERAYSYPTPAFSRASALERRRECRTVWRGSRKTVRHGKGPISPGEEGTVRA